MITVRQYGSVIGTLGIWSHSDARLMLRTVERALRETPPGEERVALEQWRKDIIRMMDLAHRENWRGWERS
ncbi:MAG: hypothetical protein E5V51_00235 [Mesorhizobium sp.]|nr:hypothetical protein EOA35_01120 [Mesorhizobium sp. M8A.F.Ca.ET.023.01.1.1]TIW90632.1 MAG: hypothetical protein E5V51_00235 [Mesorhizobium sp.]